MPSRVRHRFVVDAPPHWRPLEQIARLSRERSDLPDLNADIFMYMGCATHPARPTVHMYKHIFTRRYLNLDDAGHAYATSVVVPVSFANPMLTCRLLRDLRSAVVDALAPRREPVVQLVRLTCDRNARRPDRRCHCWRCSAVLPSG